MCLFNTADYSGHIQSIGIMLKMTHIIYSDSDTTHDVPCSQPGGFFLAWD